MDQPLATTEEAQRLAQAHDERLQQIATWTTELRTMKPGLLRTNMALEYAQEARRFLDAVENSELREQARRLHEAHRYTTGVLTRVKSPFQDFIKLCSEIRSAYEVDRLRRLEADRRQREEEAKQLALEQRAAEIEHLQEIGHPEQAATIAAQPMPAVTVSVDPNLGKVEGEVLVEVWVPKRDVNEEIVFSDRTAYLRWVAEHPEFHYLVEHRYGKLKALLTANRGLVQPPGLEIEHKFEPRTRGAS